MKNDLNLKIMLNRLRKTLGKMEVALSAIEETIVWTDASGAIQWCNASFDRFIRLPHIFILGRNLTELLPLLQNNFPVSPERHPASIVLKSTPRLSDVFQFRQDGSERTVEVSAVRAQFSEKENCVVLAIRDITERKQTEQALLNRTEQLEAANKELEAFSYSVSHDLRAPLRGIDGFSKAILEDYSSELDDQGRDFLHRIRAGAQRMGRLIDDMLNLSRITRREMAIEEVNLSETAKAIAADLSKSQPDRHVEFSIAENITARGDPDLLRIALENLLGNSWKFTSKHEHALIQLGVTEKEGKRVHFVRDDGAGFDKAYASKLFGAFQRLHSERDFPGTGIGLATTYRIIRRHGGKIWAESQIEKGATFYFTLEVKIPKTDSVESTEKIR